MFIRTASLAAAVTLAATVVSFPAYASTEKVPEINVGYADLNLATASGKTVLRSRISKAAAQICRKMSRDGHGDNCRSDLTRRTLATVSFPVNSAIAAR